MADSATPRVALVGAGGVGGHIAARLALSGAPVKVIARGEHLQAMRANGLTLLAGQERYVAHVEASEDFAILSESDLIIVSVKYRALAPILEQLRRYRREDARVLFVMNGIPWWFDQPTQTHSDAVSDAVPQRHLLWGVVVAGGQVVEPGVVRNTTPTGNSIQIGYPDGHIDAALHAAVRLFDEAGIRAQPRDDIRSAIWLKLLTNVAQSMVGLAVERAAVDVVSDPALRDVVMTAMHEVLDVGHALGIHLTVDPWALTDPAKSSAHRSSYLQDFDAGRPVDLESGILSVVASARQLDVPTPCLTTLAAIVAAKSADSVAAHAARDRR